jgi:hypothetical protein
MKDLLYFEEMLTPKLITFVYWLLLLVSVFGGIGSMFAGFQGFTIDKFFLGVIYAVIGVLASRIMCEMMIVLFKVNEALQDIRRR